MTTLMTSTNASLPKVSYVKGLDVFLGVCFFIGLLILEKMYKLCVSVFASLLEYATVGYISKRSRSSTTSRNSTSVCYYELEEGPSSVRVNSVKSTSRRSIRRVPISAELSSVSSLFSYVYFLEGY